MAESTTPLDAIDRRIVSLLQRDGRMTNAALAEAVGLTPTPLIQRIRKLEQAGVIRGYAAVVDAAKVGRPVMAFVHVTLKNHGLEHHRRLVALVDSLASVLECHHIAGEEDFLLKVCVRDIAELEELLLRDLSTAGMVGRVKTTLVLSSSKPSAPVVPAEVIP
ncbi:MAG TPA: Lrp/AsnC family transcriptional regulator [Labilithrix sp.]|nr:Lrp/AsnC family transcriptional regulator [Labilithrix sp.]